MITWLVGENTFEVRQALKKIEASFRGVAERYDGSGVSIAELPNILMGVSLFSSERLVIMSDITANTVVWQKLPDWIERVSDDIHVVFVDTKPDKRTASYKALKAASQYEEFPAWSERDYGKAEQWVAAEAKLRGMSLSSHIVRALVQRVGVDQWQLFQALEILSLLDEVTQTAIDAVIPPNTSENIFTLFETALSGEQQALHGHLKALQLQEDPYGVFALLTSQALTLAALSYAPDTKEVPKDFSVHPFVASKLAGQAKRLGRHKAARILEKFAETDAYLKRSKADPWILVERLLLHVAQISA